MTKNLEEFERVSAINVCGLLDEIHSLTKSIRTNSGTVTLVSSVQAIAARNNVLTNTSSKCGLYTVGPSSIFNVVISGLRPSAVLLKLADHPMFLKPAASDDSEGSVMKFRGTHHNNGQTDMADCLRAYCERDLSGVISPDHVSALEGETHDALGNALSGRLAESGYLRALEHSTGGHPQSDSAG